MSTHQSNLIFATAWRDNTLTGEHAHPYQDGHKTFHFKNSQLTRSLIARRKEVAINLFQQLHDLSDKPDYKIAGACAQLCLVTNQMVMVANAGDCICLMLVFKKNPDNKKWYLSTGQQLNELHDLSHSQERARIEQAGVKTEGHYYYSLDASCGLQPTRSLGDRPFAGSGHSVYPQITEHRMFPSEENEKTVIVSASDGLLQNLRGNTGREKIANLLTVISKTVILPENIPCITTYLVNELIEVSERGGSTDDRVITAILLPDNEEAILHFTLDGHCYNAEHYVNEMVAAVLPITQQLLSQPTAADFKFNAHNLWTGEPFIVRYFQYHKKQKSQPEPSLYICDPALANEASTLILNKYDVMYSACSCFCFTPGTLDTTLLRNTVENDPVSCFIQIMWLALKPSYIFTNRVKQVVISLIGPELYASYRDNNYFTEASEWQHQDSLEAILNKFLTTAREVTATKTPTATDPFLELNPFRYQM